MLLAYQILTGIEPSSTESKEFNINKVGRHNTKNLLLHFIGLTIRKSDRPTILNSKHLDLSPTFVILPPAFEHVVQH